MNTKVIRLAILGVGRVAQHYKKIIDSGVVSGFQIVGVCDINPDAAKNFADHWQCSAYSNYSKMLDDSCPDLVFVLTPSGLHDKHARAALMAGCNVLVEKPVTMRPTEAYELARLANEKKLMIGVAFQNRFNPAICCLRNAVQQKRFGRVISATIRLRWCRYQDYYEDGWHGTWSQDGGVINQQAIHHVDVLNWLIGPVDTVCATITNRLNKLEAEDTMVACLRFSDGALGTIEATTAARPRDFEASLSIVGENGMAQVGGIALNRIETWQFIKVEPEDDEIPERFSQEVPNGYGLSHGPMIQKTLDNLSNGSLIAPVPIEHCIGTTELIHALYRSHETRSWVSLKDRPISSKLGVNG